MSKCCFGSANHSADLVAVYHGEAVPLILCGYHASWKLETILKGVKNV